MKRYLFPLLLVVFFAAAAPASAQSLGTFRWNTAPFCNVINVTVTQVGSVYTLDGYEEQCGNNPRLPVSGVAIMQANGSITLGLTSIIDGHGLHTQATLDASLSGTWKDNANQSGTFVFTPGATTGGPRITPIVPDQSAGAASADDATGLKAEVAELKRLVAELLARSKQE